MFQLHRGPYKSKEFSHKLSHIDENKLALERVRKVLWRGELSEINTEALSGT